MKKILLLGLLLIGLVAFGSSVAVKGFNSEFGNYSDLKINEFVSVPFSGDEWVEIYNSGNYNVSLDLCEIVDGLGNGPDLNGTITPNGFAVFEVGSSRLNNGGDAVVLNCDGDLIDSVSYGSWNDSNLTDNAIAPEVNESSGRCLDGEDTNIDNEDFEVFSLITKGYANDCGVYPICGNGIVEEVEECDDGNLNNGDGCSSICEEEPQRKESEKGVGIGVDIETEDFKPLVWMCSDRVVYDDAVEPGRVSLDGDFLIERINNYAFEGEQIEFNVLVMDKNGIEKINDVYATVGASQGEGNDIEVNCQQVDYFSESQYEGIDPSCNARILEEELYDFDSDTMSYYSCTLTVETPESMYGKYFVTVEAEDRDGILGTADENDYWYFNPVIALSIDGDLTFDEVRPGTSSYSDTLLVGNDADRGSGVMLDMFISGTDFYDLASSGAACPVSNQLSLDRFSYFATKGAYSSKDDLRVTDVEGYLPIEYGVGFNDPELFYDRNEILQAQKQGDYYMANILAPSSKIAITFRLDLPEPCNGDFDTGSIYFWGEAI